MQGWNPVSQDRNNRDISSQNQNGTNNGSGSRNQMAKRKLNTNWKLNNNKRLDTLPKVFKVLCGSFSERAENKLAGRDEISGGTATGSGQIGKSKPSLILLVWNGKLD